MPLTANQLATIETRLHAERTRILAPSTFGYDENSGDEIPFARLDIIPWARTTVA